MNQTKKESEEGNRLDVDNGNKGNLRPQVLAAVSSESLGNYSA